MGRWYSIIVDGGPNYTCQDGDATSDLNVEMDIETFAGAAPSTGSYVRIWGVGLQAISQSRDLNGKMMTVSGGMSAGLPLANPSQRGVLAKGIIYQAFANWIGTDQSMDLVFMPGGTLSTQTGPPPKVPPKNLVLNWKKGKQLNQALQQTLQQVYKGLPININISQKLVAPVDQVGYFGNLEELSHYILRYTQQLLGGQYPGVSIVHDGSQINAGDGSTPGDAIQIQFNDLIGQPTWIGTRLIQFKTVMRADIHMLKPVTLPKTLVTNTQQGFDPFSNAQNLAFQGTFEVNAIRHVGNFRQPTADSWVSIFNATISGSTSSGGQ